MNKIVKRKLIGSILCIIIGIIFFVYPIIAPQNISENLHSYMNGFASGIIGVGIVALFIVVRAVKSPTKAQELENEAKDERLIRIANDAKAITLTITYSAEALISIICALMNKMEISEYIAIIIGFQLVIYLIVYFIVKRRN